MSGGAGPFAGLVLGLVTIAVGVAVSGSAAFESGARAVGPGWVGGITWAIMDPPLTPWSTAR